MNTTFLVTGMNCGHCARAVRTEIGALPGVHDVDVDLVAGRVSVATREPLDRADVATAVYEAGCELTS